MLLIIIATHLVTSPILFCPVVTIGARLSLKPSTITPLRKSLYLSRLSFKPEKPVKPKDYNLVLITMIFGR
jgi:hypothetical protein